MKFKQRKLSFPTGNKTHFSLLLSLVVMGMTNNLLSKKMIEIVKAANNFVITDNQTPSSIYFFGCLYTCTGLNI